jgi:hypothetical protein
MKQVTINNYKFAELNEESKQKAIEKLSDINVNYDWWEFIYEDAKTIGLKITSFNLDRQRGAKGDFLYSACEVAQNIINEHGKTCSTFETAKNFLENWQPIFNDYMDEDSENYESYDIEQDLLSIEDEFLNSLLEDYSIILQNESEYLQSEESIIETIEANDYDFTEDGKLY